MVWTSNVVKMTSLSQFMSMSHVPGMGVRIVKTDFRIIGESIALIDNKCFLSMYNSYSALGLKDITIVQEHVCVV